MSSSVRLLAEEVERRACPPKSEKSVNRISLTFDKQSFHLSPKIGEIIAEVDPLRGLLRLSLRLLSAQEIRNGQAN